MADVKVIYFEGCPNAGRLRESLSAAGVAFDLIRQDDLPPRHKLRAFSSPTILRGDDILFGSRTGSDEGGCSLNLPSPAELSVLLGPGERKRKGGLLAQFGSIASAVTVGFCPICIPAVGAFLSALGLGFLVRESVLKLVLILFLLLTVGGLFWSYRREHGKVVPLLLGAVLAIGLYASRYVYFGSTANFILMWGSIAGLLGVTVWNLRLRKQVACASCGNDRNVEEEEGRS